ncbi:MAG: hypothetical protein ACLGH1_13305 [Gammaproteobacteria bacterium]
MSHLFVLKTLPAQPLSVAERHNQPAENTPIASTKFDTDQHCIAPQQGAEAKIGKGPKTPANLRHCWLAHCSSNIEAHIVIGVQKRDSERGREKAASAAEAA